jgi:hypothetical protein
MPIGGPAHVTKGEAMPLLDLFWAMLWFFLFFAWIWLLISVFGDIFRSDDMGGGAKAGWVILVVLVPFFGVFVYLIARGGSMAERNMERAAASAQAQQEYIRQVASTSSTADELTKLADLHSRGLLTDDEFNAQKAALLA